MASARLEVLSRSRVPRRKLIFLLSVVVTTGAWSCTDAPDRIVGATGSFALASPSEAIPCHVSIEKDGRFISKSVTLHGPANGSDAEIIGATVRQWRSSTRSPVMLTTCMIPNTVAGRAWFSANVVRRARGSDAKAVAMAKKSVTLSEAAVTYDFMAAEGETCDPSTAIVPCDGGDGEWVVEPNELGPAPAFLTDQPIEALLVDMAVPEDRLCKPKINSIFEKASLSRFTPSIRAVGVSASSTCKKEESHWLQLELYFQQCFSWRTLGLSTKKECFWIHRGEDTQDSGFLGKKVLTATITALCVPGYYKGESTHHFNGIFGTWWEWDGTNWYAINEVTLQTFAERQCIANPT